MEELKKFYNLLYRFKLIVISVPLITIIIAFFLVRNLPDQYVAEGQIATGIVDETQDLVTTVDKQESSINREFSNLIEITKLQKILDLVSYQLILHDLTDAKPFRELSQAIKDLPEIEKRKALNAFRKKYTYKETLNQFNEEDRKLFDLINSMGYNKDFIRDNISSERLEISDFISVKFTSEDRDLSAFVVNTLCSEFINYYSIISKENQKKSVAFLSKLAKVKDDTLKKSVAALKDYKIRNKIVNLAEQSRKMYELTAEYETRKLNAEKDIIALKSTINNIDKQFDPGQRKYVEASVTKINQETVQLKDQLNRVSLLQIQNDFDPKYNRTIDSLSTLINDKILEGSDKYIDNPLNIKQALIQQKLSLKIQYDVALYSLGSLRKELANMNVRFEKLVPHEAVIQSLERKIEIATREYLDILDKYNAANLEASFSPKLRQVQIAMPGIQLPSKKMLLIILSGIISFIFCLLVLFE